MMTHQEIFNVVYTGLRAQEFTKSLQGLSCMYRAGDKKCAFGHLIPDEVYDNAIEMKGGTGLLDGSVRDFTKTQLDAAKAKNYDLYHFKNLYNVFTKFKKWGDDTIPAELRGDISVLQRIHDYAPGPNGMKTGLEEYARSNNLTIPE